jgi:hypothetical protein
MLLFINVAVCEVNQWEHCVNELLNTATDPINRTNALGRIPISRFAETFLIWETISIKTADTNISLYYVTSVVQ